VFGKNTKNVYLCTEALIILKVKGQKSKVKGLKSKVKDDLRPQTLDLRPN